MSNALRTPPLVGRRVVLRPPLPSDYEWLYTTACDPRVSLQWRLRGTVPSLDAFLTLLWQGTDAQHVICRKNDGTRVGLVQLFGYLHREGTARLSTFVEPGHESSGWPIEGLFLFVNYCFSAWPLRKLYLESPAPVFEKYASGTGSFFEIEGRLREHEFFDGVFVDQVIAAIHRRTWEERRGEVAAVIGATGPELRSGNGTPR